MTNLFNSYSSLSTITDTTVFPVVDSSTGQNGKITGLNIKNFVSGVGATGPIGIRGATGPQGIPGPIIPATTTTLGAIIAGHNLAITTSGVLSSVLAVVGDTPPANPVPGDQWWDSEQGRGYVFYNGQWVEMSPNVSSGGIIGTTIMTLYMTPTPPTTVYPGALWYDTTGGRTYILYDDFWVDASPSLNYILPSATTSTLGGVKVDGTSITIDNGIISASGSAAVDWSAVPSSIVPTDDLTYDLGSIDKQWRSLYVGTATIFIGGVPLTLNTASNTLVIGTSTNNTSTTALATEQFVIEYITTATGIGNSYQLVRSGTTLEVDSSGHVVVTDTSSGHPIIKGANGQPIDIQSSFYAELWYNRIWSPPDPGEGDPGFNIPLPDKSTASYVWADEDGVFIEATRNTNGLDTPNDFDLTWAFKTDGKLQLPAGGGIVDSNGASVLGGSTGNITWNGVQMIGTGTYNSGFAGNLGSIDIVPNADLIGSGQYVHIRPTTNLDETHIHVMAGNVDTADIFLGDDNRFVKIDHNGPVKVGVPVARWNHTWQADYSALGANYVNINLANPNNAWAKFIAVGDVATFPDSSTAIVLNTWLNVNDNILYVYFTNDGNTHSYETGQNVEFSIRERAEFNFGSGEGTDWAAWFGSLSTDNKPFKIGTGSSKQYGFNTAYFETGNGGVNGVFNGTRNAQYFSLIVTAHTNGTGYYTVDSYNPGNSFYSGFYFTIPGTDLGGLSPENDLVFTVTGTDGGSGAITQYSISDTAVRPNWTFNTDGSLQPSSRGQYRIPVSYTPSQYTTVASTATKAVVFDYSANNHTAKVLIQVEGYANTTTNWDTQSCEMTIATSFRTNTPIASFYGLVYTSTLPIATFDAQYNSSTGRIEIVCTKTAAVQAGTALSVVVVGTTISTSD